MRKTISVDYVTSVDGTRIEVRGYTGRVVGDFSVRWVLPSNEGMLIPMKQIAHIHTKQVET